MDNKKVTNEINFYEGHDPFDLMEKYGSPLYVYNERILRERCREIKNLVSYNKYTPHYSIKANSNITLLKIIKDEGIFADAVSGGEIFACLAAGYNPSEIFYVTNNASRSEFKYATDNNILISADSLSQLVLIGELNPGGNVAVRFNPGVGAGHSDKVITGGKKTKFGVNEEYLEQAAEIIRKYNLNLIGINMHIGSQFMESGTYFEGAEAMLRIAKRFPSIEFVDLGGGFGIPYNKQNDEKRLNMKELGEKIDVFIAHFIKELGREVSFCVEPGRYISAECGLLLGGVNAIKHNGHVKYIGTDLGFTALIRPTLYEAYHDVEVYKKRGANESSDELVSIVGNICESGDYIAKDRLLPAIDENDIIGVLDAGAYGFSMSQNYNNRPRPAEILLSGTEILLIRERDTFEDMIAKCPNICIEPKSRPRSI